MGPAVRPFASESGVAELSAYYLSCNRNKRGITLDLSHPEGVRIFRELARRSDVVLENFRAGQRRQTGAESGGAAGGESATNRLFDIRFRPHGAVGDLPGYDFAVQALSGLMSITGPADGEPYKVGVAADGRADGTVRGDGGAGLSARPAALRPRLRHRPGPAGLRRGGAGEPGPGLPEQRRERRRGRATPTCKSCRTSCSPRPIRGWCWRSATTASGAASAMPPAGWSGPTTHASPRTRRAWPTDPSSRRWWKN